MLRYRLRALRQTGDAGPMFIRTAIACLCAGLVSCGVEHVPFWCSNDADCVHDGTQGACERSKHCSFPDQECPGNRRYGGLAPSGLAGGCVPNCIKDVSLGAAHSCALLESGQVQCWGAAGAGRLGDGTLKGAVSSPVVAGDPNLEATLVAAGGGHTCVVDGRDNSVWCWGDNSARQLGVDGPGPGPHRVVALDGVGAPIIEVDAGSAFTCGRASIGTACFGKNERGQLGNGTVSPAAGPSLVDFQTGFQGVAAGEAHACGRTIAGTVHCWGNNSEVQVGQEDPKPPYTKPAAVVTGERSASLSLGLAHSCMVTSNETVACWGNNLLAGQLGKPMGLKQSRFPLEVKIPGQVTAVSAGFTHTCALLRDGRAVCWGGNEFGQLGPNQARSPFEPIPVPVELPGGIAAIYSGGLHTCALTNLDVLYCWGNNDNGQLGNSDINADGQGEPDRAVSNALACP